MAGLLKLIHIECLTKGMKFNYDRDFTSDIKDSSLEPPKQVVLINLLAMHPAEFAADFKHDTHDSVIELMIFITCKQSRF